MVMKKLYERCTDILYNRLLGYPLNKEDTGFLMNIFPLHPRFNEKVAGREIKCIIIRRHEEYHNKCFALVFSDGSYENISFTKCLGRLSEIQEDIRKACRKVIPEVNNKIISEWVKTFNDQDITLYQFISYPEVIFNNPELINHFQRFVINKTQSTGPKNLTIEE